MKTDAKSVQSIFMQAVEQVPPDEWPQFVESACGDDELLRKEVRRLLDAHVDLNSFMKGPAATVQHVGSDENVGTMVGRYKLLEQIGEGGMGTVYVSEQTEPIRRKVALKIIKPGMDSRQVIARFEAERQALAMMDHPNIARVVDAGTTEAGRPYFVMELVRGMSITEHCDKARLDTRQRLELFVDVCQAVQHAHQKGIIHRDLKPPNILVTLHDGRPVAKVIDFGVAKALNQQLTDSTIYTRLTEMIGTPLYMSPEQAELSGLDIDTRSDVYSLGVLLYELLTGNTPFDRETLRKAGLDELRRMIREDEPARPSQRVSTLHAQELSTVSAQRGIDQRHFARMLRGELDWIVMKALEKDRGRRYESASALAADVQRYLDDAPVLACPPSAGYRLRKFVRRNKGPVLAGVALAALLVLGTVGTSIGLVWALQAENLARERLIEVTKEKELATTAETTAKQEAAIAKAVNDFLQDDLLAEAAPDKNARDKQVTVEELLGRAAARIANKFGQQPRIEAAIRQSIGNAYHALGDYPAAQPQLERALELCGRVLGEEHPHTLASMNNLAMLYHDQGQFPKAEPLLVKALEVKRRVLGEEHPGTLTSMNNLAGLSLYQGLFDKAEPLFAKALEVRRRVLGEEHPETLKSMNNLAGLYLAQGQFPKAEPLWVKTLEVHRRVLPAEHPDTLRSMNNLALLYHAQGQYAKAEPLFVEALEVRGRVMGAEHPDTLKSMNNLAGLYNAQGQYAKAEPLFVEALEVRQRVLGDEHFDTLISMGDLARLYMEQGFFDKAEPLEVKTLEVRRRVLGEEHPHTLASMNNLAMLYQAQGLFDKAEPLEVKTLEVRRRVSGEEDPGTLMSMNNLAMLYEAQGQFAQAEALVRECLKISEQTQPENWLTFSTKSLLGGALLGQTKYADAEPLLLAGYEGMKEREAKIPAGGKVRLTEALERLVQLYDAWGKPEQAAEWRAKQADHPDGSPEPGATEKE